MHPAGSVLPQDRYSAKKMLKPVNFVCLAPGAKRVCLTGDFNRWNPESHALQKQPDGAWLLQVPLCHGHHQYRFLVDGEPVLDPRANGTARDHQGDRVSLIAVS